MKVCTKCGIEKPLADFCKKKVKPDGYNIYCKSCVKIDSAKYYVENKEAIDLSNANYAENNLEKVKAQRARWYRENIEHVKEINKKWKRANRKRINKLNQTYKIKRLKANPFCRLKESIRCSIKQAIRCGGYTKTSRTNEILGCTYEEFKIHIENQFTDGMTWDNYPEWEYDHIYPVSLAESEEHLLQLNHYTNFQPLWAEDNKKKGNKLQEVLK